MKLCMFHPVDHPMERGWVGRLDGEHVIHLAAQTVQSFFTGGGSAREHAVYPLEGVRLLAPVLHPPAIRVFDAQSAFEFANPAAIIGPGSDIQTGGALSDKVSQGPLELRPRIVAVTGAGSDIGGFTLFADWRRADRPPAKDRDFALGLGPVVVTPDELDLDDLELVVRVDGEERLRATSGEFDWTAARDLAADGTVLRPGDLIAGPAAGVVGGIGPGSTVEIATEGIGVLSQTVLRD